MASLDKSSVRHEVCRLKADFEKLCVEGKIKLGVRSWNHVSDQSWFSTG